MAMTSKWKIGLGAVGMSVVLAVFAIMRSQRDEEEERASKERAAAAMPVPMPVAAPCTDAGVLRVSFTHHHGGGAVTTLILRPDGSVDRTSGDKCARVTGHLPADTVDQKRIDATFDTDAWRAISDGAGATNPTYEIEYAGRVVKRSDPLRDVERPFIDALGMLGEFDMRAERGR